MDLCDWHERRVSMATDVAAQCPPQGAATAGGLKGERLARTRIKLHRFIHGAPMYEDFDLRQLNKMNEVWEIKVPGTRKQQVRLIGWFLARNHFFATHIVRRYKLGDRYDQSWVQAIQRCIRRRVEQFVDMPIYRGHVFSEYVTND